MSPVMLPGFVLPTLHTYSMESVGFAALSTSAVAMSSAASGTMVANRAIYVPFTLAVPIVAKLLFHYNGTTATGNLDMGLYADDGRRLVSSGSTGQSGTNQLQTFDIADTNLGPGLFYVAVVSDSSSSTWFRVIMVGQREAAQAGVALEASVFPLPATATFATFSGVTSTIPLLGLTTRTVI